MQTVIRRLMRKYEEAILQSLPNLPALREEALKDQQKTQEWSDKLLKSLEYLTTSGVNYRVEVDQPEDSTHYRVCIIKQIHGLDHVFELDEEFFMSPEYQLIAELSDKLDGLFTDTAYIQRGEKTQSVSRFSDVVGWLFDEARKGLSIQRYKGLGEMNPEQLWETTMNPETRRMLQVRIEDAIGADEIFTTLMGDQVEPRRDFIEKNALAALNIDI